MRKDGRRRNTFIWAFALGFPDLIQIKQQTWRRARHRMFQQTQRWISKKFGCIPVWHVLFATWPANRCGLSQQYVSVISPPPCLGNCLVRPCSAATFCSSNKIITCCTVLPHCRTCAGTIYWKLLSEVWACNRGASALVTFPYGDLQHKQGQCASTPKPGISCCAVCCMMQLLVPVTVLFFLLRYSKIF